MTRKRVQQARDSWERFLTQTGLPHTRSQTNFQFFQAPKMQASALKKRLLQQGFLVRDGLNPAGCASRLALRHKTRRYSASLKLFRQNSLGQMR